MTLTSNYGAEVPTNPGGAPTFLRSNTAVWRGAVLLMLVVGALIAASELSRGRTIMYIGRSELPVSWNYASEAAAAIDQHKAGTEAAAIEHQADATVSEKGAVVKQKEAGAAKTQPHAKQFAYLLSVWGEIARRAGIAFSIGQGTLLGWYRDGRFIPWDPDVDIYIGVDDIPKLDTLTQHSWCAFTKNLPIHRTFRNTTLVVNPYHNDPHLLRKPRFNCHGKKVRKQIDHCSFHGILGRLIYDETGRPPHHWSGKKNAWHIDIYLFPRKMGPVTISAEYFLSFERTALHSHGQDFHSRVFLCDSMTGNT